MLGRNYDKTVDLYLFGLLAYEMMVGQPVFMMRTTPEEQATRIMACQFDFPCSIKISAVAKNLISGLIVASGKRRFSIHKIKNHEFFADIDWSELALGNT